jgi:ABC-type nitrate/sulfonate/bicarbonate transport system substrate-binding protein
MMRCGSFAAQLYVADAKGFFREESLKVEIRNLEAGAAIIPALQSGSLDVGWSNSISILQARARGLPAEAAAAFRRAVNKATAYWSAHPEERAGIVFPERSMPARC